MKFGLILAILVFGVVLLFGHVGAAECRECQDLENLQRKLVKGVKLIPGFNVKCKPNSNCTGLTCNGKAKGKAFKGTVILEGCHKPVRMVIHFNNRLMYVKDGFKQQVMSKPLKVRVGVDLLKKDDTVFVTLKIETYIFGNWIPYTILKNQAITVRCSNSTDSKLSPSQDPCTLPLTPTEAQKSVSSENPECKGLMNTKKQVESTFRSVYPGSKIDCKPASNCSELKCTGQSHGDKFNTTATIDYCSDPVKLRLVVDVPNKKIHIDHTFKNGETYQITNIPPISIKVDMKRVRNIIFVTVSIPFLGKNYELVKNMSITVDPSHCHGYHAWTTAMPSPLAKCKKMDVVAGMVQKRLNEIKYFSNMDCKPAKQCSVLHCSGVAEEGDFEFDGSLNSCTSPPTLDFIWHAEDKEKTFHFKNGRNSFLGKPFIVQMNEYGDHVTINASLSGSTVLENTEVPYDPSDCPSNNATGKISSSPSNGASGHSLSGGAIGGVVAGVIIFFVLLIAVIVWIVRGKRQRTSRYNYAMTMDDDTDPLYFDSDPTA